MIHLKLQIICEQEFRFLGSGEIWANRTWNKADPYTATGDNLVRKQAQASNCCSLSFKVISLHALEMATEKGMRTNNLPRDSCFPIRTRSGPWCDALALSIAFWIEVIGWPERPLAAQGDPAGVGDLRRSADAGHHQIWAVVRTARLQMLSIGQPAPSTRGACVQTCSHSGNTHIHTPTSNKEALSCTWLVKWCMILTHSEVWLIFCGWYVQVLS